MFSNWREYDEGNQQQALANQRAGLAQNQFALSLLQHENGWKSKTFSCTVREAHF